MTKKKVQPRRARGKADAQRAADELTAERIRAILSDPKTPSAAAGKLQSLIDRLGEAVEIDTLDSPNFYAEMFADAATQLRHGAPHLTPGVLGYTRDLAEKVTRTAERHEPQAYKVARRCAEIYAEWLGRKEGRKYPDGAHYFSEHVDAVLECGEGVLIGFDSEYFVPFFVKAARDASRPGTSYRRHWRKLLDLIKRVDEGADLNALHDEAEREHEERQEARRLADLAKPEPKDKTSAEWRRWKLRRMETALRGEDRNAARAAVKEFIGYAEAFLDQRSFVVSEVEELLPALIAFWQRTRPKGKGKK